MKKFFVALSAAMMCLMLVLGLTACKQKVLIGFDIELARAVSEDLGLEVKFQEIDWDLKKTELDSKNIDVIWNGMSMLESRLSEFTFSSPYMNNDQVAVIRKADAARFTSVESLATAKLVVEKDSTAQSLVESRSALSGATLVKADSMVKAFTELMSGTSDVAIVDSTMAYSSLSLNANYGEKLAIAETIDFNSNIPYGIGMRLGSLGLKDKIDGSLARLWNDGTIAALGEKYGVTTALRNCAEGYVSTFDSLSAAEKADWEYVLEKGTLVVGYTLFSPIAYFE